MAKPMVLIESGVVRSALALSALALLAALAACDRDDLTDGRSVARAPEVEPEPDPGGNDCPPPPPLRGLSVRINEAMPENTSTLEDERGRFPPWIELYNPTGAEVHLGNVPLSDDPGQPGKWVFPCIPEAVIPPRGFLVVFADGDTANADDLHASFTLTAGSELNLILNKGSNSFRFDGSVLGPDQSAGRFPDGASAIAATGAPTPGAPNREPSGPPPARFVRGDLNGNDLVNVTDLSLLARVVAGAEPLPHCQDRADVDDDGTVDGADVEFLRDAVFGTGKLPPAPYPDPGFDPTADGLPCAE